MLCVSSSVGRPSPNNPITPHDDEQEGYYHYYYLFIFYSMLSFIPCSLNLHNRQVDDCVAGEEEVLIEGVEVEVEAEEDVRVDLSVGVNDEPESCRSAANFLLCVEMEGDPSGREEEEEAASITINETIVIIDHPLLAPAVDVDIAVDEFQVFKATAPVDEDQVEDHFSVDKHLPVKKTMPKRKHKFGKSAKRGGTRKS